MVDEAHIRERLHSAMLANGEITDALKQMESKLERAMKNLARDRDSESEESLRAENAVIDALKRKPLLLPMLYG
jgi:hypothetical protein